MIGARSWLVICAVVVASSGCGEESDATDDAAAFQRRGQELCKRLAQESRPAPGNDSETFASNLRTALANSAVFYRDLDALPTPESLEPEVQRLLALQRRDDVLWRRVVTLGA